MKSLLIMAALIGMQSLAWAGPHVSEGPGPVGTYARCAGQLRDRTPIRFEIRATAAIGFVDAILMDQRRNRLIVQLSCVRGGNVAPGAPSAGQIDWTCTEYKPTDRTGISVELQSGGVIGRRIGKIQMQQMYPLPPQVIGTLVCQ